ncbi:MAG: type II toxin-antitoxin system Phd/YefM family antitoxin [Thermoanaerobaculia bacterium]
MKRPHLAEDVRPLSEFRANAAGLIEQVRKRKRPLVLTQRGHSCAVVLDVDEYENVLEEVELLRDLQTSFRQLDQGKGVSHSRAKARVLKALRG